MEDYRRRTTDELRQPVGCRVSVRPGGRAPRRAGPRDRGLASLLGRGHRPLGRTHQLRAHFAVVSANSRGPRARRSLPARRNAEGTIQRCGHPSSRRHLGVRRQRELGERAPGAGARRHASDSGAHHAQRRSRRSALEDYGPGAAGVGCGSSVPGPGQASRKRRRGDRSRGQRGLAYLGAGQGGMPAPSPGAARTPKSGNTPRSPGQSSSRTASFYTGE